MTRCEEFYEKWKRDPNWCGKCRTEAYRINKYIEVTEKFPVLKRLSATRLRPVLDNRLRDDTKLDLLLILTKRIEQGEQISKAEIESMVQQEIGVIKERDLLKGFHWQGNQKTRQQLLYAYENTCWDCHRVFNHGENLEVHHDFSELPVRVLVLCRWCHSKRHRPVKKEVDDT